MIKFNQQEANQLFQRFTGANLIKIKAGPGTGSIFNIHLLDSHGVPFYIMVYSSWKLIKKNLIICTWKDNEEFIFNNLSLLKDLAIKSIEVFNCGDMLISIDGIYSLVIFSECSKDEDNSIISDYFFQNNQITISCFRGVFEIENN